jgi:hypothetical protein
MRGVLNGTPQFFLDPVSVFPARWTGELIPFLSSHPRNLHPTKFFSEEFLMTPEQPYFPPAAHNLNTIWRNNSMLVMTKEALLPNRCVKCNAPADEQLKRKLTWHHPALYLLVFASLLIYVVVALVVRKTATVNVGLCEEHLSSRRRNILVTWLLGLGSVLSFVAAILLEDVTPAVLGLGLLFGCAIYGSVTLRIVVPRKIDNYFVWLKGIDGNFLQQFPEWRNQE